MSANVAIRCPVCNQQDWYATHRRSSGGSLVFNGYGCDNCGSRYHLDGDLIELGPEDDKP